jgi:hypothetical protein
MTYSGDAELATLAGRIGKRIAVAERPHALEELQRLYDAAESERNSGALEGILEEARRIAADYADDNEVNALLARIEERQSSLKKGAFALWFTLLSSKWQMVSAVAFLLAILGAGIWAVLALWPVPREKEVGTAVAKVNTQVFQRPDRNSKQLMPLSKDTQVNLLERVTSPTQPFVRVQYVSARKNSRPGYIRTADLGEWSDPHVGLMLLVASRPAAGANEGDQRTFAQKLRDFGELNPNTPEADDAYLEAAGVYISLAEPCKAAEQPQPQCEGDLTKASDALNRVSARSAARAAEPRQKLEGILQARTNPPTPVKDDERTRLWQDFLRARRASEFEKMCSIADERAKTDPADAQRWKAKTNEDFLFVYPDQAAFCK